MSQFHFGSQWRGAADPGSSATYCRIVIPGAVKSLLHQVLLASIVVSLSACSRGATTGYSDTPTMTRALRSLIPVGTQVSDARRFMQGEGFHCNLRQDAQWGNRTSLNYLYCDRSDGTIVLRRWQVTIVLDGTRAGEILVTTGLVGP